VQVTEPQCPMRRAAYYLAAREAVRRSNVRVVNVLLRRMGRAALTGREEGLVGHSHLVVVDMLRVALGMSVLRNEAPAMRSPVGGYAPQNSDPGAPSPGGA
jgi:hypothetical protein